MCVRVCVVSFLWTLWVLDINRRKSFESSDCSPVNVCGLVSVAMMTQCGKSFLSRFPYSLFLWFPLLGVFCLLPPEACGVWGAFLLLSELE